MSLPLSPFPHLTLVTGGARSGKSSFAERLARSSGLRKRYIATAQAYDSEMHERIARHRLDRGPDWETIEAPLDLGAALAAAERDSITLIDCATLWLTNHLLAEADLEAQSRELRRAIGASPGPVIVVSNEVGWGIVPDNALSRRFRDAQGRLNQQLAAQAELALMVVAGIPLILKGALPQAMA